MNYIIILFTLFSSSVLFSQEEDLLALLEDEETIDYITASFKTNRIINLHSLENTAAGVLDIKISHRFGLINSGIDDLFGLDIATVRIGADYGISNRLEVGFGRSSFEKTFDFYGKYKLLRQSKGLKNMPLSLSVFASSAIKTSPFQDPDRENLFSSRLYYSFQIIAGRKVSDNFSIQLSPSMVHRNLVRTNKEKNDVYAIALGSRIKLNNRTSFNTEYIYVFNNQLAPGFRNSISAGFDIETGGHVFQLHFSNSISMVEKGFITETTGNFFDGDIHFGFNISRVFTIKKQEL